jgi:type I restriction enzyme S subunit
MSEVMAVPKLRFKEFEGDWSTNKIEEISIVTSGGTPSRNVSDYWNGDIPWVTTSLVDFNVINEAEEFITQVGLDNSSAKLFPKDTILMAMYGQGITRGKVAILGIDATTNQACAAIKLKNGFETKFIFQNLMNRYEEIRDLSNEGGQKNLSAGIIKEILISFPEKEEQTKIASFLSNVDEKISQLTQKHELLSQYKQGMMQKLFSQQIRFKADDGSEFGDWGKVKFSESFIFHNTNSYSRALLSEVGEVMNIHYGDIHTKFSMLFDISKEIVPFLNDQIDSTKIAENQFLKEGDLVIADASEDYKDIGKAIEVVHLNNQKIVAGLHTYIARPVQPFALGFCGYLMQTFEVREQIKKLATGTSVLGISKTNIGKVEIKLPCLEEQTKIANFLSSIDQKIEVVAQQIEQAKQWKKGLLQNMFV